MIVVEVMWEEWVDSVVLTWVWLEDLYNKIAIQGHREKGAWYVRGSGGHALQKYLWYFCAC